MYSFIKRLFDVVSSTLLFIILIPLFLLIALLVRISVGSPVFFRQERTGKNGKRFFIRKFRTMTEARDPNGKLLPDDQRVTKIGRFLRSSSLDELPELLSIISGSMSVIGPRPLPPAYDPYYTQTERARFQVRSGLIPPEVLHNNVRPTWDQQLAYEAEYANTLSFRTDVRIMFTVFKGLFTRYSNHYGNYIRPKLSEERQRKEEAKK